jgi:hypothetical protein
MLEIRKEISDLGNKSGNFKPHKLLAVLSVIKVLEEKDFRDGKVFFDESFKNYFSKYYHEFKFVNNHSCRPHTPFFHLKTTSFWILVPAAGKEEELTMLSTVGGPGILNSIIQFAQVSDYFLSVLKNRTQRKEIVGLIRQLLSTPAINRTSANRVENKEEDEMSFIETSFNPFIEYLNSLQRSGGSNENALAESQACNPDFASIQVSHPLADKICEELLTPSSPHIILTGHAGDGKSTIALEVFKRLRDLPSEQPLDAPLRDREDIGAVSVIKDFSERSREKDEALMDELIEGSRHFLIVSNTGTLLDFVKQRAEQLHESPVKLESDVLTAISNEEGAANLTLKEQEFWVLNLSKIDNLNLARQIFDKMLAPERWADYDALNPGCPVHLNVRLLQENPLAVDRIFLAYRKMYEYGIRLTMRQFTEHLAYIITAGLSRKQLEEMPEDRAEHIYPQYLFFNTFFGDNGTQPEPYALEMKAVQEIRKQGFGSRPAPGWEHRLWLLSGEDSIQLGTELLEGLFEQLLDQGAKKNNEDIQKSRSAREQVRRMLYFLYRFDTEEDKNGNYISRYLNTPMLLKWRCWQTTAGQLELSQKSAIERQIYHVLQEHFSGVRIPEGVPSTERRLYITLSRKRSEVRQSAQVVLAELDWSSSVELKLEKVHDACGESRRDLLLRGKGTIQGLHLPLHLPFLDFVMMRHQGELGEVLQASYMERLDRFKAQVHERARQTNDHEILLVRLKTDHTFRRQLFAVKENKLEVTHVS